MSDIKLVRPHSLPLEKAKALTQKTADALAREYDLESEWQGNTLRFHRSGVDGQMQVTDSEIRLDVKLGLLLKAFKGKIAEHIERNFDELLDSGQKLAKKSPAQKTAGRK
ncbi:MAG TPA: polyhydroxyalkanoic acid system family protein [Burkholderiaceae bacterium]|jgi:putative polyhydroxyalkanoate system protein|nr:polyhydroxyalkanoic acid system family protein [Burkholderiaceae bacterium]